MRARVLAVVTGCALVAALLPAALTAGAAGAASRHAVLGDFDGDGVRDLAIGAPERDRVRVRYSRSHHVVHLHRNAPSVIPSLFGTALAVGDFNGDGYGDLAVGAPDFQPPNQSGGLGNPTTQGAVFEFDGSRSGLHARPLQVIGPYDGDEPFHLGDHLAAADVNRDGRADLAATLFGADIELQFFHGSATGLRWMPQELDGGFDPSALAFADLNGDHRPDLVVGDANDFNEDGSLRVFFARPTGRLAATPHRIRGRAVGVRTGFGSALAVGDVNGDGHPDVVVGAADDGAGSIVVLTGDGHGLSASRHQRIGETRVNRHRHGFDGFGAAVAVGRVTGDRFADVVVGAPGESVDGRTRAGALYVLRGSAGGLTLAHHQRLTQATVGVPGAPAVGARLGSALYVAQLVGRPNADVAVGAPGGSPSSPAGFVLRFHGAAGGLSTTAVARILDGAPHDRFGAAAA